MAAAVVPAGSVVSEYSTVRIGGRMREGCTLVRSVSSSSMKDAQRMTFGKEPAVPVRAPAREQNKRASGQASQASQASRPMRNPTRLAWDTEHTSFPKGAGRSAGWRARGKRRTGCGIDEKEASGQLVVEAGGGRVAVLVGLQAGAL
eukprot:6714106-Prymnesium_polylepis.1